MNDFPAIRESSDSWLQDGADCRALDAADRWIEHVARQLMSRTLQQLLYNQIPYIELRLLGEATCDEMGRRLTELAFDAHRDVESRIDWIGCTVLEYNAVDADKYFATSALATRYPLHDVEHALPDIHSGLVIKAILMVGLAIRGTAGTWTYGGGSSWSTGPQ